MLLLAVFASFGIPHPLLPARAVCLPLLPASSAMAPRGYPSDVYAWRQEWETARAAPAVASSAGAASEAPAAAHPARGHPSVGRGEGGDGDHASEGNSSASSG